MFDGELTLTGKMRIVPEDDGVYSLKNRVCLNVKSTNR